MSRALGRLALVLCLGAAGMSGIGTSDNTRQRSPRARSVAFYGPLAPRPVWSYHRAERVRGESLPVRQRGRVGRIPHHRARSPKPPRETRARLLLPTGLACIRRYESHDNYGAVSASGRYRGAYQFDAATWRSVGGVGDPALASRATQDAAALRLFQSRGSSPWPVTSRRCGLR